MSPAAGGDILEGGVLMVGPSLRALALSAVAAVAALSSAPTPAAAVTPVSVCGPLDKAGETYVLAGDITTSDLVCFLVLADRITLDLRGHTISGPGASTLGSVGIWDDNGAGLGTVVRNGTVQNFDFGIFLQSSTRSTIRSVNTSDNRFGMVIGDTSLVKDCTVQRNSITGIVTGNGVQVEDCDIGGTPGGDQNGNGLVGGQRMLVTKNTVKGNTGLGILVGINSTVTHNQVSDNGGDGIAVGLRSLVTSNVANNNGQDGIEAVCPSTITFNEASGNSQNYNLIDIGLGACFFHHNTEGPAPI
jgi:hypothetical protein